MRRSGLLRFAPVIVVVGLVATLLAARPALLATSPAGHDEAPNQAVPDGATHNEAVPDAKLRRPAVVPAPAQMRWLPRELFALTPTTRIAATDGATTVAHALAEVLRPATGYAMPVSSGSNLAGEVSGQPTIRLTLDGPERLGPEGYRLQVTSHGVDLQARTDTGLFRGIQTLRQLLPAQVESDRRLTGPWTMPGVQITDRPRFAWRGAMLDVARHFLGVADVKRYVDLLALYKVNVLHLHLTDDQGWRIEVDGWPRLTRHGGSTEVGGGPGGFYTQQQYAEIVRYAQARHITVVPEVDMPGHTTAALASYPELACNGKPRPLYTGTQVGFSSLCVGKPVTYRFVEDVITQVAALTPGPYLHIGGDEAHRTPEADYATFVTRVERIVRDQGKQVIGWEEVAAAGTSPPTVAQHWFDPARARGAAERGMKVVMSPARKAYLDMRYDAGSRIGLDWAGPSSVRDAYSWDPGTWARGVPASAVLGVEAPLWTETVESRDDLEYLAFPRVVGVAERGWSPARGRSWADYRRRLAAQGPRWDVLGVSYFRAPAVPWPRDPPAPR